jgi:hypothetical protein
MASVFVVRQEGQERTGALGGKAIDLLIAAHGGNSANKDDSHKKLDRNVIDASA